MSKFEVGDKVVFKQSILEKDNVCKFKMDDIIQLGYKYFILKNMDDNSMAFCGIQHNSKYDFYCTIDAIEHYVEPSIEAEPDTSPKHDHGKERYDLLPFRELDEIVKALTFGAEKYSDNGWKSVENGEPRYQAAMIRHISAYMSGEKTDDESGLSHLAHAGCCLLFLMWYQNMANSEIECISQMLKDAGWKEGTNDPETIDVQFVYNPENSHKVMTKEKFYEASP